MEENKDNTESKEELTQRVTRIMVAVDPPQKKVNASKDFRSFIKAQAAETKPANGDDVLM